MCCGDIGDPSVFYEDYVDAADHSQDEGGEKDPENVNGCDECEDDVDVPISSAGSGEFDVEYESCNEDD